MFNGLTIRHLVIAALTASWMAFLALATVAVFSTEKTSLDLAQVAEIQLGRSRLAASLAQMATRNRTEVLQAFQHDPAGALFTLHNHPIDAHLQAVAQRQQVEAAAWRSLKAAGMSAEEAELVAKAEATFQLWHAGVNAALDRMRRNDFSPPSMAEYLKVGREQGDPLVAALDKVAERQMEQATAAAATAKVSGQRLVWLIAGLSLGVGVPGIGVCLLALKRLSRGFHEANEAAAAMAAGDLTKHHTTESSDEVGALLKQLEHTRQRLLELITGVRQSADSILTASAEVAAGNLDLSQRTEQTAGNLQRTSGTAQALGSTVQHNASSAQQASDLAGQASQVAERGGSAVAQVVTTMKDIEQGARKIAEIIGVIDGIAFQTNILALNAAVEAARAGDHGRGFAVVAGEVRALAQRSAQSAREIKDLIGASVSQVEAGSRHVDDAGRTMHDVVDSIQRVAQITHEISQQTTEQSRGVADVSDAVRSMDESTQHNAALVEQTAAAAESLRDQAQRLAQSVASFRLVG